MVKSHKAAGWHHILLNEQVFQKLDAMRVLTPTGEKEGWSSFLQRLAGEGVLTPPTVKKSDHVNTKRSRSKGVNTTKDGEGMSLEAAVELVQRRKGTSKR